MSRVSQPTWFEARTHARRGTRHNRRVKVQLIEPDAQLGMGRGDIVVCFPVYDGYEHFVGCLRSVLAHTPLAVNGAPEAPAKSGSSSPTTRARTRARSSSFRSSTAPTPANTISVLAPRPDVGFPANVNGAFAMASSADVVVVELRLRGRGRVARLLREAAYGDSRIATATAHQPRHIVSVPHRSKPVPQLPPEWSFDDAAAVIRERSLRIRPSLPTAIGHCMFIRRSALDLVGDFDPLSPGLRRGGRLLAAVPARRPRPRARRRRPGLAPRRRSFGRNGKPSPVQEEHERLLVAATRTTTSGSGARGDVTGPLARALGAARRALTGLSVAIDARILAGPMTGTQLHVLELIASLARTGQVRITAIVPDEAQQSGASALKTMPDVRLLTHDEATRGRWTVRTSHTVRSR